MRQFYNQHHKSIAWQALQSGSIIALFLYITIRGLFYEFPMSWTEESVFFIKVFLSSAGLISGTTGTVAFLYRLVLKIRRY
jgi:hypothetical protein